MTQKSAAFIWSYLSQRRQRVKVYGAHSDWKYLSKGVPQGSILGPIVFNIFISDLYFTIKQAELYNYADDNTLSVVSKTIGQVYTLLTSESLSAIDWFKGNLMEANPGKFQAIIFNMVPDTSCLDLGDATIPWDQCVKLLGVNIDSGLNFSLHIKEICRKAAAQLNVLQRLSHLLDLPARMLIFRCFILSHFNYCSLVWHFCGLTNCAKLERLQYRALKFVYRDFSSSYEALLDKAKLPTLELSRKRGIVLEVFKSLNNLSPSFMKEMFPVKDLKYSIRKGSQLNRRHVRTTKHGLNSLSYIGASLWNSLPGHFKTSSDLVSFKALIQTWTG